MATPLQVLEVEAKQIRQVRQEEFWAEQYGAADKEDAETWDEVLKEVRRDRLKAMARRWMEWKIETDLAYFNKKFQDYVIEDKRIEAWRREMSKDRNDAKAKTAWFLTVNPPERIPASDLWSVVRERLEKSRTITGWHMVIEQRSTDVSNPHGWHVHVCLNFVDELSKSEVKARFQTLINLWWTKEDQQKTMPHPNQRKKLIDWSWFVLKPLEQYHRAYIEGEKRPEKMAKVEIDRVVRGRYGFPEFLSGGDKIIFPGDDIDQSNGCSQISQEASPPASSDVS